MRFLLVTASYGGLWVPLLACLAVARLDSHVVQRPCHRIGRDLLGQSDGLFGR